MDGDGKLSPIFVSQQERVWSPHLTYLVYVVDLVYLVYLVCLAHMREA